tara:strand:+ start:247 stop:549 length:303 start_codon:yes stop_codon:yes gene_type:complete
MRGWHDLSASTAAGKRFATAVPEVVMTQLTCPLAALIPKARNAADLSSIDVIRINSFCLERLAAANARGPDLLPGQRRKYFTPFATRVLRSSKLEKIVAC